MPDPKAATASPVAATSNWADVPGSDIPFGELFGSDPEVSATTQTETQTTATPEAAPTPQAQVVQETPRFRIETETGTVYDSLDAASKGIAEKDTLIKQLRDRVIAATGVDPLAKRPPQTQEEVSYLSDPQRFAKDLSEAATKGDASKYVQGLVKLFDEYISPVKPILQDYTRRNAQSQISSEIKEWDSFRNSSDYEKVLDANPDLKNAIAGAEQDIRYGKQLPGLYKLAYAAHTYTKLPELLQAAQAQATTAAPVQQVRQTPSSSTLTPANPVTQTSRQEMLRTAEGRAEIKRQFESSGNQNLDWNAIRWGG